MLHHSFDDQRICKPSVRQFTQSILFYMVVSIVLVLTTGIVVILGLSAVNRLEPALKSTHVVYRPNLPMSNGPGKGSKDANVSDIPKLL